MSMDKPKWMRGEWTDEPDRLNYKTDEGFDAAIIRTSHSGCLCGYVGVPAGHPWYGMGYSAEVAPTKAQIEAPVDIDKRSAISLLIAALGEAGTESVRLDCLLNVHGGLTYADNGIAEFGEDPSLWYFGFDCAHSGDASPAYDFHGTYRDIEYVKREIAALSKQLAVV
jgi:hypothetical protein